VERTLVILLVCMLVLNFVIVPLLGLRIGSRRRMAAAASGSGLRTDGYGSILLSRLVVQACRVLGVEKACLLVADGDDPRRMIAVVGHGMDEDVIGERVILDVPLQDALLSGGAHRVDAQRLIAALGPGTAVVMPADAPSRELVLCAATSDHQRRFDQRDIALVGWLARLCASAVEDLTIKDRLDAQLRVCTEELAAVCDFEERALPPAGIDAVTLASHLGTRLVLEPGALVELEIAARVSQGGKPVAEFAERLARVPGLEAVALIVRFMPERWDGRGPHGLPGHRIPLASRILAACSAMRVLTANRAGDARTTVETALRQVQRASGTLFDPTVVAALSHELIGDMPEIGEDTTPAADWASADAQYAGVL
jgi:hypothetical protein